MPLGFGPPNRLKPPLDLGPFSATNKQARLTDALSSIRPTQTYEVVSSSGDPADQIARPTQTYEVVSSSGDPTAQIARPTQTYEVVNTSGDPTLQLARPTQTYVTIAWTENLPVTPIIKTRSFRGPYKLGRGPFLPLNHIDVVDSSAIAAQQNRARSYGYIF